jgi:uncharacterized membrane protein/mono/diheme cytochrome c family protein
MILASLIGNLHPAIVHLPIGILILAVLLEWLILFRRFHAGAPLIPLITAIGAISAVLACVTGLLLESSGEYNGAAVDRHKWAGLISALIATVYHVLRRQGGWLDAIPNRARWGSLLIFASVTVTGHWGGDLTHGSGFVWKGFDSNGSDAAENTFTEFKPVANVLEAKVYPDLVAQVMQAKCVSCHGAAKQKGGLRLDDPSYILRGGKNGVVIKPGSTTNSELFKRLLLPPEDEYHMPPKEKPQLSTQDRTLIEWWISKGADFKKTVKEIGIDDSTLALLKVYEAGQKTSVQHNFERLLPEDDVPDADPVLLEKLRAQGIVILQIDPSKGYLMANLMNTSRPVDSLLMEMESLSRQLVWLKLSGTDLSDDGCRVISKFNQLIRLQIDQTRITDAGLSALVSLAKLEKLNLAGDRITLQGIRQLKSLTALKSLNIWKTGLAAADQTEVFNILSGVKIDTGGYTLPFLPSDTMVVQDTRKK